MIPYGTGPDVLIGFAIVGACAAIVGMSVGLVIGAVWL